MYKGYQTLFDTTVRTVWIDYFISSLGSYILGVLVVWSVCVGGGKGLKAIYAKALITFTH